MAPGSENKPWPLGVLLFGVFALLLAVAGTFTGKAYGKGWIVDEAKNPVGYWLTIVVQGLIGAVAILYWAWALRQ